MSAIYRLGEATVAEVRDNIPDAPSYSAVRALITLLESKGQVRHRKVGRAYVYRAVADKEKTRHSALRHLMQTFFEGSVEHVVAALLGSSEKLSPEELDRLERLIRQKRKEGET